MQRRPMFTDGLQTPRVSRAASRRTLLASLAGLPVGLVFATGASSAEDPGGPLQILISYRCAPADRAAFRAYLSGEGRGPMSRLALEGALTGYDLLFNPFTSEGSWDALLILSFARYADTQRWKLIERTMPGGLTPAGLRLARPIQTYSADLGWEGVAPNPGPTSARIAYVIPYSYTDLAAYKRYVEGLVLPQLKGWIAAGVLSRYRLFLNRYPVGDPWDALFVYEYRDLESFGRREAVMARVRAPLRADPAWKALNDVKATIRSESENTIADLLPRR